MTTQDIRIKIVRLPILNIFRVEEQPDTHETFLYPPAALGHLTAYLRGQGFHVEQDDLNIKLYKLTKTSSPKIDLSLFLDEKRILKKLSGHQDKILDESLDRIIELTTFKNFDLCCLSCDWRSHYPAFFLPFLLANRIKEKYGIQKIVMGGGLLRALEFQKEAIFENPLFRLAFIDKRIIDYYIFGPGERAIHELIKAIWFNGSLDNVPGLFYYANGTLKTNAPAKKIELLKPDYEGLPLEIYRWSHKNIPTGSSILRKHLNDDGILILPFTFIDSCPFKCAFCPNSNEEKTSYLDPKTAVRYLKEMSEQYQTTYFVFYNNNINFSSAYANRFCDEILSSGLKIFWKDCATSRKLDKNLLRKMQQSGCISLVLGFETGSPRLQEYVGKKLSLEHLSSIIKDAHDLNMWTELEVIAGLPTEKDEDIKETIKFIKDHQNFINTFHIASFFMAPKSRFLLFPEKYGLKNVKPRRQSAAPFFFADRNDWFTYDEARGLAWKEKQQQIAASYERLKYAPPLLKTNLFFDDFGQNLNILFLLFQHYGHDKKKIETFYYNFLIFAAIKSKIISALSIKRILQTGVRRFLRTLALHSLAAIKFSTRKI